MKKSTRTRGFTLAELLIVVAIIAILAAIAFPVFNSQLNKAREAVDLANARSAESIAMSQQLLNEDPLPTYYLFRMDENQMLLPETSIYEPERALNGYNEAVNDEDGREERHGAGLVVAFEADGTHTVSWLPAQ